MNFLGSQYHHQTEIQKKTRKHPQFTQLSPFSNLFIVLTFISAVISVLKSLVQVPTVERQEKSRKHIPWDRGCWHPLGETRRLRYHEQFENFSVTKPRLALTLIGYPRDKNVSPKISMHNLFLSILSIFSHKLFVFVYFL